MRVAVAGATGAVGREMLRILEERNFPADEVVLLASERSAGRKIPFRDAELTVSRLTQDAFKSVDLALFSCGASRSLEFAPAAVKAGAVVVDNSSAFRMDEGVPLVVPEVNPETLEAHQGNHRQPELLDHPTRGGAQTPARRRAHQASRREHLSGGERGGAGRDRRDAGASRGRRLRSRENAP